MNYNQDVRDSILEITSKSYSGGIETYSNLSLGSLENLVSLDFIDLTDRQNVAPSAGEFLEFMKQHPNFKAHGYAVSKTRPDYRVTIEGLQCSSIDEKDLVDFQELFREADEFTCKRGHQSCWYD